MERRLQHRQERRPGQRQGLRLERYRRCSRCGCRRCMCVITQNSASCVPSGLRNSAVSVVNDPLMAPLGSIFPYNVAAERGMFYTVTSGDQYVTTAPSFLVLQLTNPANSGKTVHVKSVLGSSSVSTTLDIFRDAVFTASGSAVTSRNANWRYLDSSVTAGKWMSGTADPTVGGVLLQSVNLSGGATDLNYDGRIIMPSDTTDRMLYIRLTSLARNAHLAIDISWWEV